MGFLDDAGNDADLTEVDRRFAQASVDVMAAEKLPPFFTLLPDMQSYRSIVGRFGPHEAVSLLTILRDVVTAQARGGGAGWLRRSRRSDLFTQGFIRSSEAYFAWRNAGTILDGEEYEEVGRLSETLRIRFRLSGRRNDHELDFHFPSDEPILPKRFAVVIGKNGVGKSQTLSRMAKAALRNGGDLTDGAGDRPMINRLLAFHSTTSSCSVFPAPSRTGRIWYRRFSLTNPGTGRLRHTTSELMLELARGVERIAGFPRMRIFLDAIRTIDGHQDIVLRLRKRPGIVHLDALASDDPDVYAAIDDRAEPMRLADGELHPLSSGEMTFVRFAALTSLYVENSSLLLFDEPETHLHPNFISQFVIILDTLLERTGSAAIIATHSAYFVRETFENQVRVLRNSDDGTVEVVTPRLRTFGADVGTITQFVFGEDEPSRLARRVEDRIAATGRPWASILHDYGDRISLDLLGELRGRVEKRR